MGDRAAKVRLQCEEGLGPGLGDSLSSGMKKQGGWGPFCPTDLSSCAVERRAVGMEAWCPEGAGLHPHLSPESSQEAWEVLPEF